MTASLFSTELPRATMIPALPVSNRARTANRWSRQPLWMLLSLFLYVPQATSAANNSIPADSGVQVNKPLESPIKFSGVPYKSGGRRDPFTNPLLVKKKEKQTEDEEISRGVPPPGIAGTFIAQAVLQGIAMRDNRKVAVFRGADSRAYFIRKGDRLFDGYVKEIFNDSVTLVRETRLRSGKTLTQDVTKRLRTQ